LEADMQKKMAELQLVKEEAENANTDLELKDHMFNRMTSETHELKNGMKQIDWMLTHQLEHLLDNDSGSRFCLNNPAKLDMHLLRQCGMKGLPIKSKLSTNWSALEQYWAAVVSEWQEEIDGGTDKNSDDRLPMSIVAANDLKIEVLPPFDKQNDFIFKGGNYVDFRKTDEVRKFPPRPMKDADGNIVHHQKPDETLSADFYRAMEKQFGAEKTGKIMNYIMGVINKSNDYSDLHSGYSVLRIPWDLEANKSGGKPMTADQKIAFVLSNMELKDSALDQAKLQKAGEVAKAGMKQVQNDHLNEVSGFRPEEAMDTL